MLTPQQISQIKAVSNPTPTTIMTPDQAKAAYASKSSGSITQKDLNIPVLNGKSDYFSDVSDAASAGVNQIKQGYDQFKQAGNNPVGMLEGGLTGAAGVAGIAASPLAPISKVIGQGVDPITDTISNNPSVQKFANSPAGEMTSRIAKDVGNASTVAGIIGGGMEMANGISNAKPPVQFEGPTTQAIAEPTASSVVSYVDKSGNKIITRLTPDELKLFKDEVKNIPEAKNGNSQIHLDPANSQTLNNSKMVSREEFISGHPQAAEMFGEKQSNSSIKDAITGKIQSIFKGKTVDEILATPGDKLQRLSPSDRKVYFDAQRDSASQAHTMTQEKITQKSEQVESGIKSESDKAMSDLQSKTQDLANKVDRASIEEAQGLKPKVIQSMKENSQTYRDLIDKEISQHSDVQVTDREMNDFIDSRYADNPSQANAVKDRLGLNKSPETEVSSITKKSQLKDKLPTIQTQEPTRTIGDIYNNTKSLKQDISMSAKKGNKAFTVDDKLTDDSISVLSDFMKSKGVDLSEANNFWRNYAPLRDKVIKSIQPFTPRGAESGSFETFAKDIQKSVKGIDEGNKDFISATEKLLNTKIGSPKVIKALENLNANEKAQIAQKISTDSKVAETRFAREQAIKEAKGNYTQEQKNIDNKEFEVERKAKTRENIWRVLKWTGAGAVGLEEFKRLTGL